MLTLFGCSVYVEKDGCVLVLGEELDIGRLL